MSIHQVLQTCLPERQMITVRKWHYRRSFQKSSVLDEADLRVLPSVIQKHWRCLDVGANIGIYTKHLAKLSASVIAFEPVAETFSYLANNVRDLKNVSVTKAAISNHNGFVSMDVPKWQDGTPNLYESRISEGCETECFALDSLPGTVDFIKIDVEDHELEVLKGAVHLLQSQRPMLLIETGKFSPEVFALLQSMRYLPFIADGDTLKPHSGEQRTNYWFKG